MAEEETFKVMDRRGRDRAPAGEETPPSSPGADEPAPASRGARAPSPGEGIRGKPDLQSVFVMFASTALVALGVAPNPADGQRSIDLDQARDAIDLLLLLREKTEGNRAEQESRVLEQILYDLQMRFVEVSAKASRA